jgi:hypothetical protein
VTGRSLLLNDSHASVGTKRPEFPRSCFARVFIIHQPMDQWRADQPGNLCEDFLFHKEVTQSIQNPYQEAGLELPACQQFLRRGCTGAKPRVATYVFEQHALHDPDQLGCYRHAFRRFPRTPAANNSVQRTRIFKVPRLHLLVKSEQEANVFHR